MFDKLKSFVENVWNSTNHVFDKYAVGPKKEYTVSPAKQMQIQQRFDENKTLPYSKQQIVNNFLKQYSYEQPTDGSFNNPFTHPMRQVNQEYQAQLDSKMAPPVDYVSKIKSIGQNIGQGIGAVGNGILDWTLRPIITRPVAQAAMTGADIATNLLHKVDPRMPEHMPSVTATDPAGKLLFGNQPMNSYTGQARSGTNWLEDVGVNKNVAMPLGIMAGTASAAMDATGVGGVGKGAEKAFISNLDDAAEVAWKSTSAKDKLKTLLTYKDQLIKSGWTADAVEKMSAKDANIVIKNGITPKEWITKAEDAVRNTPLWADFKNQFSQWVGKRQASKFEGIIATDGFKRLDELGPEAFQLIENGNHKPVFESLRGLLDEQWKKLNDAGIRTGYVENYLPHLFQESKSETEMAIGRRLSKSSQFSLSRILKDYSEGLAAGLTPKYNKLSDVIGAYVMSTEKSVADKQFYDWLRNTKTIMTPTEISKLSKETRARFADWVPLSSSNFGFDKTGQVFKADPDMAGVIDNYLLDYGSNPSKKFGGVEKALKAGAALNTQLKNWKLSAGIPGTGVNSFGLMSVRRHMYAGNNPIKNLAEGVKWMLNPKSAGEVVQSSMKELPDAVKHGLTVSIEDHDFFAPAAKEYKNILTKSYGVVSDKLSNWFEKPLFQNVLPAMKMKTYKQNIEIFLKQGLDSTSAKELSAKVTNDIYGGLNLDQMMRDKGTQTVMRNIFLAPDLYESQYNVGKGLVQMFKKNAPEAKVYQLYARNMLMDLVSRNILNKTLSGHYMFENSEGNKMNLDTGTYQADGTHRYIKTSGADVVKIPMDIVDGIYHKDLGVLNRTIRNRFSMTLGAAWGIRTNTNYAGNQLYYPDDSALEKAGAIGNEVLGLALPSQATAIGRYALGKQGLEQTGAQLAELPIYYREGPYSKKEIEATKLMQQGGMTGQDINQSRNDARDIQYAPKLTEDQKAKNLQDGLPINTERNWLGFPKKNTSPQNDTTGSNSSGNVSSITSLQNKAKEARVTSETKATIKKIFETDMSEAQIEKTLNANNITMREAYSVMGATLQVENGDRGEFILPIIKSAKSKEELLKTIQNMADDDLLTTGVTAQWVDDGIITKEQKKFYDSIIKGKDTTGTGSGTSKLPASLKLKLPAAPTPSKTKAVPTLQSFKQATPIMAPKMTNKVKLPSMSEMKAAMAELNKRVPKVEFSPLPK